MSGTSGTNIFNRKTGEVFVRNFDRGVIETLGGYIERPMDPAMMKMLGGSKRHYFIDIPEIEGGGQSRKVPVMFGNPEAIRTKKVYPSFLIVRESIDPALNRWQSIGQKEYRVSADGATPEVAYGVSGYSAYEEKVQDMPMDIAYTISVQARLESHAIPMLKHIMRVFKPYCEVIVFDSRNEQRTYTAYNEAVVDIGELIDVADRMKGYAINLRVEAELSLSEPVASQSMRLLEVDGHEI